MKHLFCVHSSITFYISKGIISFLNINPDDVIFFIDNHYLNKYEKDIYNSVDGTEIMTLFKSISIRKFLRLPLSIWKLDAFVREATTNEKYILYIPNTTSSACQSMITNSLCVGYNLIEEGIGSYKKELFKRPPVLFHGIKHYLLKGLNFFSNRIEFEHPFLAPYRKSSLRPKYFYFKSDIEPLTDDFIQVPFPKYNGFLPLEYGSHIFIVSPLLEYNLISEKSFISSISYLVNKLKNNCNTLYIKYHPFQDCKVKALIEEKLEEESIKTSVINDDEPMEPLIMSNRKLFLYGYESSLLFYASQDDTNRVYSLDDYVYKLDNLYRIHKKGISYELLFRHIEQL